MLLEGCESFGLGQWPRSYSSASMDIQVLVDCCSIWRSGDSRELVNFLINLGY